MLECYEESISLTLRTRSSKKPLRMQDENWKHQRLQPCLARHARKASMVRPAARLMISSLNLRERVTRNQLTSRTDHLWPELWKSMGKHAKLKKKQKWSHEKLHLENARKFRGIYFIDPEDKEFKEFIKNARKKLETPMAPAMPCKINKNYQN